MSGLDQAFALAAAELGMASAGWLFAREAHADGGDDGVHRLRDELGRRWPVADAVCAAWLEGQRPPQPDAKRVMSHLTGISRLVVIGVEAWWLDALVSAVPATMRLALMRHSELSPDWSRVVGNLGERVELVELADFQSWAGQRSALLTFVYGGSASGLFALSAWARVAGPDVRTQFRDHVAWDVLRRAPSIYPRWLVSVSADDFTAIEGSA